MVVAGLVAWILATGHLAALIFDGSWPAYDLRQVPALLGDVFERLDDPGRAWDPVTTAGRPPGPLAFWTVGALLVAVPLAVWMWSGRRQSPAHHVEGEHWATGRDLAKLRIRRPGERVVVGRVRTSLGRSVLLGLEDDRRPLRMPRRCTPRQMPAERVVDPEGLASYVDACARRLWGPEGRPVRRWLSRVRGLPDDVLHLNRIGADPGARQPRPAGMPAAGWAAVLPVDRNGEPVFAQIRVLGSSRLRYLNAASTLTPNPRIAEYEPAERQGSCVVVTEGVLDALSAAAAGLRGVALLGASLPDPSRPSASSNALVDGLTDIDGRLVLALDADEAGQRGADRLQALLAERRPDIVRVTPPAHVNDLNDWMPRAGDDWSTHLTREVRLAIDCTKARSLAR